MNKRTSHILLFGSFLAIQILFGQQEYDILPDVIKDSLDKKYSNWYFPELSKAVIYDFKTAKNYDYLPNLVWGDFDGNDSTDYAIQFVHGDEPKRKHYVLAFLKVGNSYEEYVIKNQIHPDQGYPFKSYLWLINKGSSWHIWPTREYFEYKNDSIAIYWYATAGRSYVFENGRFRSIQIAD